MSFAAEKVQYRAGGRALVEDVSLRIEPGEVHAVLGPNGAGKSSLLRLLAGELRPGTGAITLNGRPLAQWTAAQVARQRAVLPQSETLRFAFAVEEVVALGRYPCPRHRPQRESEIVRDALRVTDAEHLLGRRYPTLSGGERQRVQLARVLAQVWEPVELGARYVLLDEPTASLDLAHQHQCLRAARAFAAQGAGVLVVLHDPNLAMSYADRVTMLCCGQQIASGTPADVLTPELLQRIFGVRVRLLDNGGRPFIAVEM